MLRRLIPRECTASQRHHPPCPALLLPHSQTTWQLPFSVALQTVFVCSPYNIQCVITSASVIKTTPNCPPELSYNQPSMAPSISRHAGGCFHVQWIGVVVWIGRHSGVNRYLKCRLCWVVTGRDHSAQPDSTWLNSTTWVEVSWIGSGTVLVALDYSGNKILYLGLLVWSVDLLATTAVVHVCIVMRHDGKGTRQTNLQCMVHTACL